MLSDLKAARPSGRPRAYSDVARSGSADDTLSNLLHDLRIVGVAYRYGSLSAPWGLDLPYDGTARLHCVIRGEAWLTLDDGAPRRLAAGDVAFLPRGASHRLTSAAGGSACTADRDVETVGERVYRLEDCAHPDAIVTTCSVSFNEPCLHPVLELMPEVIFVTGAGLDQTLTNLLAAMSEELVVTRIGGATVLARLADVVITRVIRCWIDAQDPHAHHWLTVFSDARIGRVVRAVHRAPDRPWTVTELASAAGLSRSAFIARFTKGLGIPPGRYLARLKMQLASRLLKENRLAIAEISRRLAYCSVPAFSRAVKRHLGRTPGELQRQGRTDETRTN